MSHQTGTTMLTLPAQMRELMPLIILARNNQMLMEIVGTVPALQCHGRGTRTRKAQMKDATGSSACMVA
jgi:hypothetical protein